MTEEPWYNPIVVFISGMSVPLGSPQRMHNEVQVPHEELVKFLDGFENLVAQVAGGTAQGASGDWPEAYVEAMKTFLSGGGEDYLSGLRDTAAQLADGAHEFAYQLDYTNLMIVLQVLAFLVEWAITLTMWEWNPIGAAIEQAFLKELFKILFGNTLRRFLTHAAMTMVTNVALSTALDGLARWILALHGEHTSQGNQYRKSAVLSGAVQGAFGAAVPLLTGPIKKLISKGFSPTAIKSMQETIENALQHPASSAPAKTAGSDLAGAAKAGSKSGGDLPETPLDKELSDIGGSFGPKLAALTVPMRVALTHDVVSKRVQGEFRDAVGKEFETAFGKQLGSDLAREMGTDWAAAFMAHAGGKDLSAALKSALGPMEKLGTTYAPLRAALSDGVTKAMPSFWKEKPAHLLVDTAFSAGYQNLSEGVVNYIEQGKFSTSKETTFGAMGGDILGRAKHPVLAGVPSALKGALHLDFKMPQFLVQEHVNTAAADDLGAPPPQYASSPSAGETSRGGTDGDAFVPPHTYSAAAGNPLTTPSFDEPSVNLSSFNTTSLNGPTVQPASTGAPEPTSSNAGSATASGSGTPTTGAGTGAQGRGTAAGTPPTGVTPASGPTRITTTSAAGGAPSRPQPQGDAQKAASGASRPETRTSQPGSPQPDRLSTESSGGSRPGRQEAENPGAQTTSPTHETSTTVSEAPAITHEARVATHGTVTTTHESTGHREEPSERADVSAPVRDASTPGSETPHLTTASDTAPTHGHDASAGSFDSLGGAGTHTPASHDSPSPNVNGPQRGGRSGTGLGDDGREDTDALRSFQRQWGKTSADHGLPAPLRAAVTEAYVRLGGSSEHADHLLTRLNRHVDDFGGLSAADRHVAIVAQKLLRGTPQDVDAAVKLARSAGVTVSEQEGPVPPPGTTTGHSGPALTDADRTALDTAERFLEAVPPRELAQAEHWARIQVSADHTWFIDAHHPDAAGRRELIDAFVTLLSHSRLTDGVEATRALSLQLAGRYGTRRTTGLVGGADPEQPVLPPSPTEFPTAGPSREEPTLEEFLNDIQFRFDQLGLADRPEAPDAPVPSSAGAPPRDGVGETGVAKHVLWHRLFDGGDGERALADVTASRGAEPSPAEVQLRREARDLLTTLPGLTVLVGEGAGYGHQAAAVNMLTSLTELGYTGRFRIIAPGSMGQRMDLLLPPAMRERVDWIADEFGSGYEAGYRENPGHPVFVAAIDTLSDDPGTALDFLNFTGADRAVILKPYAWGEGRRMLYTRDPDGTATVTDLQDKNGISGSALFHYAIPHLTGPALEELINAQAASPEHAADLIAITRAVHDGRADLMPVYGAHALHPSERATVLPVLAEGLHAAALPTPVVILAVGDAGVAYAPRHEAEWLHHHELGDPGLPRALAEAGPGDVLVVMAGGLKTELFQQAYQLGTLPALTEGANTTAALQLQGRPYFSTRTAWTPYDLIAGTAQDQAAVATLTEVTEALSQMSEWGQEISEHPIAELRRETETAISTLRALQPPEAPVLTVDDADRFRVVIEHSSLETHHDAVQTAERLLGTGLDGWNTLEKFLAPADQNDYRRVRRLGHLEVTLTPGERDLLVAEMQRHQDAYLEQIRQETAHFSIAPTPDQITTITNAITDAVDPSTVLGSYFQRLTHQAHHPDNDQVLQAIARIQHPGSTRSEPRNAAPTTEPDDNTTAPDNDTSTAEDDGPTVDFSNANDTTTADSSLDDDTSTVEDDDTPTTIGSLFDDDTPTPEDHDTPTTIGSLFDDDTPTSATIEDSVFSILMSSDGDAADAGPDVALNGVGAGPPASHEMREPVSAPPVRDEAHHVGGLETEPVAPPQTTGKGKERAVDAGAAADVQRDEGVVIDAGAALTDARRALARAESVLQETRERYEQGVGGSAEADDTSLARAYDDFVSAGQTVSDAEAHWHEVTDDEPLPEVQPYEGQGLGGGMPTLKRSSKRIGAPPPPGQPVFAPQPAQPLFAPQPRQPVFAEHSWGAAPAHLSPVTGNTYYANWLHTQSTDGSSSRRFQAISTSLNEWLHGTGSLDAVHVSIDKWMNSSSAQTRSSRRTAVRDLQEELLEDAGRTVGQQSTPAGQLDWGRSLERTGSQDSRMSGVSVAGDAGRGRSSSRSFFARIGDAVRRSVSRESSRRVSVDHPQGMLHPQPTGQSTGPHPSWNSHVPERPASAAGQYLADPPRQRSSSRSHPGTRHHPQHAGPYDVQTGSHVDVHTLAGSFQNLNMGPDPHGAPSMQVPVPQPAPQHPARSDNAHLRYVWTPQHKVTRLSTAAGSHYDGKNFAGDPGTVLTNLDNNVIASDDKWLTYAGMGGVRAARGANLRKAEQEYLFTNPNLATFFHEAKMGIHPADQPHGPHKLEEKTVQLGHRMTARVSYYANDPYYHSVVNAFISAIDTVQKRFDLPDRHIEIVISPYGNVNYTIDVDGKMTKTGGIKGLQEGSAALYMLKSRFYVLLGPRLQAEHIIHELGHWIAYHKNPILFHKLWRSQWMDEEYKKRALRTPGNDQIAVEGYAGTNPMEFVAEAFRAMVMGHRLPSDVARMYKAFDGPAPRR
ncbi:hypothetical protein [Streptomyces sp. NPDC005799]|uniref:hypothetical protein n=1 Tax=Streptomyces sp. NPDC005799 TaxID=3154678 RepID=UPI0033D5FF6B